MNHTEEHFRETFRPELAAVLLDALKVSYKEAREISVRMGFGEARTEPTIAYDLTSRCLERTLEPMEGVHSAFVNGQRLWIVGDYALRVKKLDSALQASNHYSRQQEQMSRQLPLPGLGPIVYVTAGPCYSDSTGLIQRYVVVKYHKGAMSSQRVEWFINLEDLAAGNMVPAILVLPLPQVPTAPATVIARRSVPRTSTDEL